MRRLPREQREADILAAARDVFRAHGYEQASISEIAERAGVVEGSIYRYFTNKRDLLAKVIQGWYGGMLAEEEKMLPGIQGTRARLRHTIWHHLKSISEEPGLSRLVFAEFRPDPDYRSTEIFEMNRRYTRRVTDIVTKAVAAGEFREDVTPALVRDLVFGGIEHHTWAFLRGSGRIEIEATADMLADLIYRGLAAPASEDVDRDRLDSAVARLDAVAARLAKTAPKAAARHSRARRKAR